MKTRTIFTIFAAITLVLGISRTTVGQQNSEAQIQGKATVVSAIAVTAKRNLEFGILSVAGPKTIALSGAASGNVTGGTQTSGKFQINKGAGTSVDLTFTVLPGTLSGPSSATLPITYVAEWSTDNTTGGNGTSWADPSVSITPSVSTLTEFYVYLGGTVTPDAGGAQVQGDYAGTIKLQAEYN